MPSAIEKPTLQRVDFHDLEKDIVAITKDSGVILQNFTTPEIIHKVNAEVQPFLDADKPWKVSLPSPRDVRVNTQRTIRASCSHRRLDDVPDSSVEATPLDRNGLATINCSRSWVIFFPRPHASSTMMCLQSTQPSQSCQRHPP